MSDDLFDTPPADGGAATAPVFPPLGDGGSPWLDTDLRHVFRPPQPDGSDPGFVSTLPYYPGDGNGSDPGGILSPPEPKAPSWKDTDPGFEIHPTPPPGGWTDPDPGFGIHPDRQPAPWIDVMPFRVPPERMPIDEIAPARPAPWIDVQRRQAEEAPEQPYQFHPADWAGLPPENHAILRLPEGGQPFAEDPEVVQLDHFSPSEQRRLGFLGTFARLADEHEQAVGRPPQGPEVQTLASRAAAQWRDPEAPAPAAESLRDAAPAAATPAAAPADPPPPADPQPQPVPEAAPAEAAPAEPAPAAPTPDMQPQGQPAPEGVPNNPAAPPLPQPRPDDAPSAPAAPPPPANDPPPPAPGAKPQGKPVPTTDGKGYKTTKTENQLKDEAKANGGYLNTPEDQVHGNGQQCTALVKYATGLGPTSGWKEGDRITGSGTPPLEPGTGIAVFNDGKYTNSKESHAAIFEGYDVFAGKPGIKVVEQYQGGPVQKKFYPFGGTPGKSNPIYDANNYSVIRQ